MEYKSHVHAGASYMAETLVLQGIISEQDIFNTVGCFIAKQYPEAPLTPTELGQLVIAGMLRAMRN